MVVIFLRSIPSPGQVSWAYDNHFEPRWVQSQSSSLLYCWFCHNFHRRDQFTSRERLLKTSLDKRHCLKWQCPEARRLHLEQAPDHKPLSLTIDVYTVLDEDDDVYHFVRREPASPSNASDVQLTPDGNAMPTSSADPSLHQGSSSTMLQDGQRGMKRKKKRSHKRKGRGWASTGGGGSTGRGMAFAVDADPAFDQTLSLYNPSIAFCGAAFSLAGSRSFSSTKQLPRNEYYQDEESCAMDALNLAVGEVVLHRRCLTPPYLFHYLSPHLFSYCFF